MTDQEQKHQLGKSKEALILDNRQELTDAIADMISQGRLNVCIFSHDLEPKIFNRETICQSIRQMIIENKRTKIQILVQDIEPIRKYDHCLLGLMRHLSSFVEIRKTSRQHISYDHAFVTVDDCGYYHRHPQDSRQYEVCYNNRLQVKLLLDDFKEMWEQSLRATELLSLHI